MTQEEKARAYDEALETARKINSGEGVAAPPDWTICEVIFPELKESGGEKVRKALINLFKTENFNGYTTLNGIDVDDVITWLEKQGEQRSKLVDFDYNAKDSDLQEVTYFIPKGFHAEMDGNKVIIKRGEKKTADNIEPKFHEGDWVVDNCNNLWKIVGIMNGFYILEDGDEGGSRPTIEWVDKTFHLWTIEDAKKGDVLAAHECIVLFKEIDGLNIKCYCTYHYMGFNPSFHIDTLQNKTAFNPATKEQRDLLFAKMKEEGWEWDADKKELKKIEDEEYNGEDYGIDSLYHAQRILEKTLGEVDGYQTDDGILSHKCAITAVKKLYEKKPVEWSEEDEKIALSIEHVMNCASLLNIVPEKVDKIRTWIKSLKQRMEGSK